MNNLIGKEIKIGIINKTPDPLKNGTMAYFENKGIYIHLFNRWVKYRWYHKLLGFKPKTYGLIKDIDTSEFSKGDVLYVSRSKPGALTTNPNE